MRREFCQKGDIYISYTDSDVAFEDVNTAESILFGNDGSVIHNNFENDPEKQNHLKRNSKKYIRPSGISGRLIIWEM
jgi:hypothetical protein